MQMYESKGILSIRPGIQLPFDVKMMRFDPNAETEFSGQLLLAHECFYEFREAAEFIALIDWDDLLVTAHFDSLYEAFRSAFRPHRNAAYFLVNKLEASFIEQGKPLGIKMDWIMKFNIADVE